jgi:hypothetical protein
VQFEQGLDNAQCWEYINNPIFNKLYWDCREADQKLFGSFS